MPRQKKRMNNLIKYNLKRKIDADDRNEADNQYVQELYQLVQRQDDLQMQPQEQIAQTPTVARSSAPSGIIAGLSGIEKKAQDVGASFTTKSFYGARPKRYRRFDSDNDDAHSNSSVAYHAQSESEAGPSGIQKKNFTIHRQSYDTFEESDDDDNTFLGFTDSQQTSPLQRNLTTTYDSNASGFLDTSQEEDLLGTYHEHKTTLLKRKNLLHMDPDYINWKHREEESSDKSGNILIRRDAMMHVLSNCACPQCGDALETECRALDMDYEVKGTCQTCNENVFAITPEEKTQSKIRPTTAGIVQSCIDSGTGYAGFQKLVRGANLDSTMSNARYSVYSKTILNSMSEMYDQQRPIVNRAVRREYAKEGISPDEEGILDVAVSFDGTWQTRGHHSNIGAGFVIDSFTGTVLDFEVKSKFCQRCALMKNKYNDVDTLAEKMTAHKLSGDCHVNYQGSSGGMERAAAVDMWNRSINKNCMRYTTFISDGDSSAYTAVKEAYPYGDERQIEKQECVNHVAKRIKSRLTMLKQTTTVPKQTKSGKTLQMSTLGGVNKLTKNTIDQMALYFANNIISNKGKTVESMKKSIFASYNHVTSSDKFPMHDDCPEGADSYCFIKKHEAAGTQGPPPSHSIMQVRCQLNEENRDLVRNVYSDLCTDDLLSRCLGGKTQNPNESFHSKVWTKLPKVRSHSLPTVKNVTARTILEHNLVFPAPNVVNNMGFDVTSSAASQKMATRMEKERVRHSKSTGMAKKVKNPRGPHTDADYGAGAH